MARYRTSRIFPVTLILIVIAIAVAALISISRTLFFSDGTQTGQVTQAEVDETNLLSKSVTHSVTMSVRGKIVADEDFRSYGVTISPTSRKMTTYKGYLDREIDKKTLSNNSVAYEEFVYALDKAGLLNGKELSGDSNDIRGVCATGDVYTFDVLVKGKSVKNLWTTTCNSSKGSLSANVAQLKQLFLNQIPSSSDLIRKIDL